MRSKNILSGKNLYAIQIKVIYIFTTPFVPNEPTFPLYYDFKNKLKGSFIRKTQNKHSLIKFYDSKVFLTRQNFIMYGKKYYFGDLQKLRQRLIEKRIIIW